MPILLGAVVLVLLLWAASSFSKADPKQAARLLRNLGGGAALLFAAFLLLRGEIGPAVTVGVIALGVLGWVPFWPASLTGRTRKSAGQVSRVRTAYLEMELDHDSGTMRGRILAGAHQGASLDALEPATLVGLLGAMDADSGDLLAAYLDRRRPGWREHAERDAATGRGRGASRGSKMTEEEAYQILGVEPGAGAAEVSRAHRSLMKKLHPDQGGSTYLAARVNEAKDVLLRRHR
ncbi:MAG: DnaJ domain-containing protein [Xanthobacteraceae bacterium]